MTQERQTPDPQAQPPAEDKAQTILLVAAHPDDAEFSSAGTVAKWTSEGRRVIYVLCTNGDKGSHDPEMTSERLVGIREREQRAAAAVLGVSEVVFLGHPDGGLEDTYEFRGEIVRAIRRFKPDRVLTSNPHNPMRPFINHRDHRMAGRVTLDAVYPYCRDRLHYPEHLREGLEPHRVEEVYLWGSEDPDVIFDVSPYFELKLRAIRCHESQVGHREQGDMDFGERMRRMSQETGKRHGVPMAETFKRVSLAFPFRQPPVKEPPAP